MSDPFRNEPPSKRLFFLQYTASFWNDDMSHWLCKNIRPIADIHAHARFQNYCVCCVMTLESRYFATNVNGS